MPNSDTPIRDGILGILRSRADEGCRKADIRRALEIRGKPCESAFREAFRELLREGTIAKRHRGGYVLACSLELVSGRLTVNRRGFGFVTPDAGDADIFIPPKGIGGAMSGDRVLVALGESRDDRGPAGTIRKVLDRQHSVLTGQLTEQRGVWGIRPMRRELPDFIPLVWRQGGEPDDEATPGEWVIAQLEPQTDLNDPLVAVVVDRIAGGNSASADLDAIVSEFDLPEPYTEQEEQDATAIKPVELMREDCRELATVTIDPDDAKDYDDALSVTPGETPGTVRVGVHIADVAAYVPAGASLDDAARRRGFTVYLPGRTLPMLPTPLASDLCSLVEGDDRLAHSVFLDIDETTGCVTGSRRARTVIKVSKRLTFAGVQDFVEGQETPDWPEKVTTALSTLTQLHRLMRERRREMEEFLDLSVPEAKVVCEGEPLKVVDVVRTKAPTAHAIVEEFMLAANVAVAEELVKTRLPGVFRVHDTPKPREMSEFSRWCKEAFNLKVPSFRSRSRLNGFLAGLRKRPIGDVVTFSFLSTLQRAVYAGFCHPHFGLGKERYCHFTSPIRRYPDLLVHQQLLARDQGTATRSETECTEIAEQCTGAEKNGDQAFFAAVDRLKLRYVDELSRSEADLFFEGTVARILPDAVLVFLSELCVYGAIPISILHGSRPGRNRQTLRGPGKAYKCGDVTYVQVRRVDTVKGQLELQPVRPRI